MGTKTQAAALLDRLVELDYQTVEAYYDMGSIISSMQHGGLYMLLGYDSMSALVEEELTYTPSTANKYATMYRNFRRMHYVKDEAIKILKQFGLTPMCKVLPGMPNKIGVRAIKARVDAIDQHQINFTLDGADFDKCHRALQRLGATQSDDGRYINSSGAFMQMVNDVLRKPKLKAVA